LLTNGDYPMQRLDLFQRRAGGESRIAGGDCRRGKGSKALFSPVLVKNLIARRYHSPTPDLKRVDPDLYNRYSLLQSVQYAWHRGVFF